MYCTICNKHIGRCACPDADARLETLKGETHVVTRWCNGCGKHADRCKCADGPSTKFMSEGREVGIPELKPLAPPAPKWFKCPECGSEWKDGIVGLRAMIDCTCECEPVEIPTPESHP